MLVHYIKVLVLGTFFALTVSACHQRSNDERIPAGDIERTGRIVDLKTGTNLSSMQLAGILAAQPRVIVGEKHDNPFHHQAEYWLIKKLSEKRAQGSVLMEMITPEQQDRIAQVQRWIKNTGDVRESRLRELLHWDDSWPWDMYGELVMQVLRSPYLLLSANISRTDVEDIYKHPRLPEGELSSRREVRDAIREIIIDMHGGELPDERLESMLAVQQHRDRSMAKQLIAAPLPAMLIAGGYHAARNIGVPLHVRDSGMQASPVVLMLAEEGMHITSGHADYVWYFPVSVDMQSVK